MIIYDSEFREFLESREFLDYLESAPTCDQCDRTIWCEEVHAGAYVFCSVECRDDGAVEDPTDDNVARTETGAQARPDLLPAPTTASHGTRATCVASVPSSSPARRPEETSTRADLSRLVSSVPPFTPTP